MEHEVFVAFPAGSLRRALADPARVARAVPGLQQDAGAEPVSGRLKLRIGSHSITYRGTVRITARDDGTYAVEGDAAESRGSGAAKFTLTVTVRDTEGGASLTFAGTASADGRIADLAGDAVTSAVTRLLSRFAENLGEVAGGGTAEAEGAEGTQGAGDEYRETVEPGDEDGDDAGDTVPADEPSPVAEAAHARRTMIGRSAEEVDHAPPRGRYAPVPAPQTASVQTPLRWAVPAAAVVLASAIVVGRVLRKRR